MAWFNISRKLSTTYGEYAIGWVQFNNNLWVITNDLYTNTGIRMRKASAAEGEPYDAWGSSYLSLPKSVNYDIQNSVEDLENNRLFIANSANGEIYFNDYTEEDLETDLKYTAWQTISNKTYGEYTGEEAQIQQLVYYNKQIYIAHKGGVSVLDYKNVNSTWRVVGDFTKGFDGVGECRGFYVLNNELYVSVAFGDLGAIYKYNMDVVTTEWIKVAELPMSATNPQFITSWNNTLFVSNEGMNQNIFNNKGIDETLTGQPRLTQGKHLIGVPSDMILHTEDNSIYVTCWNKGYSSESDTHTDNLISAITQIVPYNTKPGETFFTGFTPTPLSNYTSATLRDGGNFFTSQKDNPDLSIEFRVTSNALKLLPGETYTIVFEYGFHASATSQYGTLGETKKLSLIRDGISSLKAGFKSSNSDEIDTASPNNTFTFNEGTLFSVDKIRNTQRVTFSFNADDMVNTNGEFIIEGKVSALIKGAERQKVWAFLGNALIKNIKLFRGDKTAANSMYIPAEYVIKEYSLLPAKEKERHAIKEPSPPDEWFIKFNKGNKGIKFTSTLLEGQDEKTSVVVDKLSRTIVTNKMKLYTNSVYRMHALINREDSDSGKPLHIKVTPSIKKLAKYAGITASTGVQNEIVWEFNTTGIPDTELTEISFQIDAYEENIIPFKAGAIYISDINLLGKIRETPVNTVYRYDGEVWDNALTKLSNDDGIELGNPYKLVQNYEPNSGKVRLYCISLGRVYVWSIEDDPYGRDVISRIITSW